VVEGVVLKPGIAGAGADFDLGTWEVEESAFWRFDKGPNHSRCSTRRIRCKQEPPGACELTFLDASAKSGDDWVGKWHLEFPTARGKPEVERQGREIRLWHAAG
jgi:hypothetical protein